MFIQFSTVGKTGTDVVIKDERNETQKNASAALLVRYKFQTARVYLFKREIQEWKEQDIR